MGDWCLKSAKPHFIPQPLPHPLIRTLLPPFQYIYESAGGSTRLAVIVKHGLQSSRYFPGTAASVMARLRTLCIATVTVLVILAAALQPGEHYLTASICICNGLCQCLQTKRISLLPPIYFLLHALHFYENDRSNISC